MPLRVNRVHRNTKRRLIKACVIINLGLLLICLLVETDAVIGLRTTRIQYQHFIEYGLLHRGLPPKEYDLSNLWIFAYDLYVSMRPLARSGDSHTQFDRVAGPLKKLGIQSSDYKLLYKIGAQHDLFEQEDAAIETYLESIEVVRKTDDDAALSYPCPHQGVGMLFFKKGDFVRAKEALEETIKREGRRGNEPLWLVYYELADIYLNERRYEDALALMESCREHSEVRKNPRFLAQSFNLRGEIHNAMKAYEKAEQSFLESIRVEPEPSYEPLLRLGWVMDNQHRYEEALDYYREALKLDPGQPRIYEGMANAYNGLGKLEESRAYYEKALEKDPRSEHAMTELGIYYLHKGDDEKAESLFNRALKINPDRYTCVHEGLGLLLLKKGEVDKAEEAFKTAIRINPDIEYQKYNGLGRIYLKRGEMDKARKIFDKSLENYPWPDNAAHQYLSEIQHETE